MRIDGSLDLLAERWIAQIRPGWEPSEGQEAVPEAFAFPSRTREVWESIGARLSRLFTNDFVAMSETRHGRMLYNIHDLYVGRSVDLYGEWAWNEVQLLERLLRPGAVVVDAGANIGTHTLSLSKIVGSTGQVWSFEPQRLVFQLLCANVALNARTNVQTIHAAVGAAAGQLGVPYADPRRPLNMGAVALVNATEGSLVPLVTLDSLALTRCDLVKIDVEGMEREVLSGADTLLRTHQPALFIENNNLRRSRDLIKAVLQLGYTPYWFLSPYFNPQNYRGATTNIFENHVPEANMVCAPPRMNLDGLQPVEGPDDTWKAAWDRLSR